MERKREEQLEGRWDIGWFLRQRDGWGGWRTNFLEGKLCYRS